MNKYILLLFVVLVGFTVSDVQKEIVVLTWQENSGEMRGDVLEYFQNADLSGDLAHLSLPVYSRIYPISTPNQIPRFTVVNPVYEDVTSVYSGKMAIEIPSELQVNTNILRSGNERKAELQIIPIKEENGKIYRLKSFQLRSATDVYKNSVEAINWKSESVLASGKWVKIRTSGKGIYKIPFSMLNDWGFSEPTQVGVFGSGGKMLSEDPGNLTYDDLEESAIWTAENGGEQCLFFYAPGVTEWTQNESGLFIHSSNEYTASGFFFVGEKESPKQPEFLETVSEEATHTTTEFDCYDFIENDKNNLLDLGSGKRWFGNRFTNNGKRNYSFELADLSEEPEAKLTVSGAARSYQSSSFDVNINSLLAGSVAFKSVDTDETYGVYADDNSNTLDLTLSGTDMDIAVTYDASNNSAEAWMDYIELNYRRNLVVGNTPLFFRDSKTVGEEIIVEFQIADASADTRVMDVSDINNVKEISTETNGSNLSFTQEASSMKEYAVFNTSGSFPEPVFVEDVENQNLHAISTPEFIIISHKNFLSSAEELADFHRSYDGMSVEVVDVDAVYNEFSSGSKNATGIRNFVKMMYDRGSTLKYVLLFGDGSYDNRNINGNGLNFIPTYQSSNSLDPLISYVSDDYFVMLDAGEKLSYGSIDLGIGRIPASTTYEAQLVVNKIKRYYEPEALGSWRNVVCMIGDDGDTGIHMRQAEQIADSLNRNHGEFITEKIYFDAYTEEVTPAGERYPDVNDAINERVEDGVLVLNYIGHANNRFLAHEHVLEVSDINSWSNRNQLPIYVTATCEFSRFDADDVSAGEYVLMNPNGGGIGLFSTTRVVTSGANFQLSKSFYRFIFAKDENGEHYRMGDVMRLAKSNLANGTNKRNFSLLADPALKLSYPKYQVITTSINGEDAASNTDTIGTLEKITIEGYVADYFDNRIDDFNGEITHTVYDKEMDMKTLGNGDDNRELTFQVQNNIIYSGTATVTNGNFSFSFVVPKDISYKIGAGKIIYYAQNGDEDAHGAFTNFSIGGEGSEVADNNGPEIQLYLDSEDFQSGDKTGKNPTLLAYLSDENGINTVGTGIGHDITAVIDNDYSKVYVLNNYYQAEKDDYTSGSLQYPLSDLSVGTHTLSLKAWDVANNSSEVEIEFEVTGDFIINEVSNYPNPIADYTYFVIEHNQAGESFSAVFDIYNINGKLVDQFETEISSSGNTSNPVRWDLSESKIPLTQGVYVYQVFLKNNSGVITSKSGKLLVAQ
ncbi:type IX secretion system sortase PorU [Draconibacterium sp. IB214405]|uniref:type IX secretion system sortase PorU n=1 Tax=Draconibacterium sp. IB214405 TaxID=3097352 RepID=UPI002A0C859A|nr:type IX secretion system sortase PorU [Draconibacterium sp. IB214405]MDX8338486.1 type IX secretion system sortase PorU [Draconibacterium sp. IB214405]